MHDPNDARNNHTSNGLLSEARRSELSALVGEIIDARSSREHIRVALRPFCIQARDENLDATDLVKLVKQSFAGAALTASPHATERQQTLDRIISVCIDEYYSTD